MTDREKLIRLAHLLGDEYSEPDRSEASLRCWGKRFAFNRAGELVRVSQEIVTRNGIRTTRVLGRADE